MTNEHNSWGFSISNHVWLNKQNGREEVKGKSLPQFVMKEVKTEQKQILNCIVLGNFIYALEAAICLFN